MLSIWRLQRSSRLFSFLIESELSFLVFCFLFFLRVEFFLIAGLVGVNCGFGLGKGWLVLF